MYTIRSKNNNLIAVFAYPIVFWLIFAAESFLTTILGIYLVSSAVSNFLFALPFLISPVISGWIANSRPVMSAVSGSLLNQVLIIAFAPTLMRLFFGSGDMTAQKILASLPQVDIDMAALTLRILAVIFLPVTMFLAVVGGIVGSKIRKSHRP